MTTFPGGKRLMTMLHLQPPRIRNEPPVQLLIVSRVDWVRGMGAFGAVMGVLLAANGDAILTVVPHFARLPGWPWLYGWALFAACVVVLVTNGRPWHRAAQIASYVAAAVHAVLVAGFIAWFLLGQISEPPYPAAMYSLGVWLHLSHARIERRVADATRRR